MLSYTTSSIRRFKPLVVVTQDLNGEYGHGGHMLFSHAVTESVESSSEPSYFPDSASKYGTWDVPKTYLHLYSDNKITMNLRLPLSRMGNRTSIEVQTAAYKNMYHSSGAGSMFQMTMNTAVLTLVYTEQPLAMTLVMICWKI